MPIAKFLFFGKMRANSVQYSLPSIPACHGTNRDLDIFWYTASTGGPSGGFSIPIPWLTSLSVWEKDISRFSGRSAEERWTSAARGRSRDGAGSNFTAELRWAAYWTVPEIDLPRWVPLTHAEMVSVSICVIFFSLSFTPLLSDSLPQRHPSFQSDSACNRLSWNCLTSLF